MIWYVYCLLFGLAIGVIVGSEIVRARFRKLKPRPVPVPPLRYVFHGDYVAEYDSTRNWNEQWQISRLPLTEEASRTFYTDTEENCLLILSKLV